MNENDAYCAQFKCYAEEDEPMNESTIIERIARAKELDAKGAKGPIEVEEIGEMMLLAPALANDCERLVAENKQLKAERDVARHELKLAKDGRVTDFATITRLITNNSTTRTERDTLLAALSEAREAFTELLKLRKNCEGDIGWRGKPSAVVDNIRVKHILLIEGALTKLNAILP